jgi:hypothetical protein
LTQGHVDVQRVVPHRCCWAVQYPSCNTKSKGEKRREEEKGGKEREKRKKGQGKKGREREINKK